ncbi:MAG: AAA family ATPase [Oscillospiraceae bacterium]|nr:AAA family ATPase [Oscillospiraceae bacterium]
MESNEINKPHGIIIFGANGSGKTTLGRELARVLNYKHMDIEDYYFEKSEIPYAVERPYDDCLRLMLADIKKYNTFIISAVTGDFGDIIPQFYKLAVYVSAPLELRLKRIEKRGYEQHGECILKGGDMHKQHIEFVDFVASRSLKKIDTWAKTLLCPLIHVDGTKDCCTNAKNIAKHYKHNSLNSHPTGINPHSPSYS